MKIKDLLILAAFAYIAFSLQCGNVLTLGRGELVKSDTIRITAIDTLVKVISDTVWQTKPIYITSNDTIYIDTLSEAEKVYYGSQADSNITINYAASLTDGVLIGVRLNYLMRKPLKVSRFTDRLITKNNTVAINNTRIARGLYIGGGVGNGFKLGAKLSTGKNIYGYDYDFVNKSHTLSYYRALLLF